ncbi:MAG: response regulator [Proteobacteria bacterium]|nr:response regulator [Pseudomonadota bacterium]MBU1737275.1 response regulator [Pseudomonadota bacterium]
MVGNFSGLRHHASLATGQLLGPGEKIFIVDDDPSIREPLKIFLEDQGLSVGDFSNAEELLQAMDKGGVALVLLDIGLPDIDGRSLLPQIHEKYPDVAVIMLTGVADLKVALDCIREGADDYLSKPVQFSEILIVVKKTLEKRRLIFENRKYHEDLEKAHFRIHVLHQLSVKMNHAYLSTVELDEILQAVLVGITANEGLRFNRAFLAMFDDDNRYLEGRLAIGPDCRDDAGKIWAEMQDKSLSFLQIVNEFRSSCNGADSEVNRIIKELRIPADDIDNILIKAARERRSIRVSRDNGSLPVPLERRSQESLLGESIWPEAVERRYDAASGAIQVPHQLMELLNEDTFVIVPLFSPSRPFGVIIADNFVTRQPISDNHIGSLELFASQASLAIEHSHLYRDQQLKIEELESLNEELDKNKDLLIEADRYSALGQMAAQLVHSIRNPITSIGGSARILNRKYATEEQKKFLEVISTETDRLEKILDDLCDYTEQQDEKSREPVVLYGLLRKTMMLVQQDMQKQQIRWELECDDQELKVVVNPKQIRQIFLHLFKNAVEAMPEGGFLKVVVSKTSDWVIVSVSDTGIGMSEDYIEKAADPFFTTKTYGTGMGLTMVEKVLENHGGFSEIKKSASGGLDVVVYLPVSLLHNS